jgi:hypothetical protein
MLTERLVAFSIAALLAVPAAAEVKDSPLASGSALQSELAGPVAAPLDAQGFNQLAPADRSGVSSIFSGALYGGLAGALIGGAVGLIENGNYGRDIAIGAGAGILIGAALGAGHVFGDSRALPASDGLNTTDRFPVIQARTMGVGGRF